MKILLVGNCQVAPIRNSLVMMLPDCSIDGVMLHLEKERDEETVRQRLAGYDLVVTHPANPGYEGYSTDSVKSVMGDDAVITFNNIHFEGLHPDATYLGAPRKRVFGTLGEYHSKLVAAGFLAGLSEAACRDLFNGEHFEEIGFLSAHEQSLQEFDRRSKEVDVPFAEEFAAMLEEYPCMLTFNHPTSNLLIAYARKLAREVANRTGTRLSAYPVTPYNMPSFLSENIVWPIYPAIAEAHTGGRLASLWFRREINRNPMPMLSVEDLIAADYARYRDLEPGRLEQIPQMVQLRPIIDAVG